MSRLLVSISYTAGQGATQPIRATGKPPTSIRHVILHNNSPVGHTADQYEMEHNSLPSYTPTKLPSEKKENKIQVELKISGIFENP